MRTSLLILALVILVSDLDLDFLLVWYGCFMKYKYFIEISKECFANVK